MTYKEITGGSESKVIDENTDEFSKAFSVKYPRMSKISVIGAGNVGATIANDLMVQGIASEILLVDVNKKKAKVVTLIFRFGIIKTEDVRWNISIRSQRYII